MSRFPQYNVNSEHQLITRQNTYVLDRKLVTIHTEDRDVSQWPNANYFEITLPATLTNVQSLRLVEIEFPANQYVFSNYQQNTKLQFYLIPSLNTDAAKYGALVLNVFTPYEIQIQEGFFTPSQMAMEIENLMNNSVTEFLIQALVPASSSTYTFFKVYYDQVGQKMYFGNTFDRFEFKFNESPIYDVSCSALATAGSNPMALNQPNNVFQQYANWGLPAYLGFNKLVYTPISKTTPVTFEYANYQWLIPENGTELPPAQTATCYYIVAPYTINIFGDSAVYMELEKFNSYDELKPYPMSTNSTYKNDYNGSTNSAFAKIAITAQPNGQIFDSRNGYLQNVSQYNPTIDKIRKLKFKFRYHDGRLVDFRDTNFNFTIAFNQLKNEINRDYQVRTPYEYNL
jgi:hypothetical protein